MGSDAARGDLADVGSEWHCASGRKNQGLDWFLWARAATNTVQRDAQLECLELVIPSLDASQSRPLISISLEPTPAARPRTAAALQGRAATTTLNSQ